MATLMKADGTKQEVHPADGKQFTLKELQGYVGGYIEMIDVGEGLMWVNEEGKLDDLPINAAASRIARPYLFWFDDGVRGDVVVMTHQEADGEESQQTA